MSGVPGDERGPLMAAAYRMLGSVSDAEDAVQEAYARWYALDDDRRREVRVPAAWLMTTVSRICLDTLRSARVRRERAVGEWLPEPVPGSPAWTSCGANGVPDDPAEKAALVGSLDLAVLVVMETMSPAERVAFVLHDVFSYRYEEISPVLGRTPHACRQLAFEARRKARAARPGHADLGGRVPVEARTAFRRAWEAGDLTALVRQLAPEVRAVVDGGGLVSAPAEPVRGAWEVAGTLLAVRGRQPDLVIDEGEVNGSPGLVTRDADGTVLAVVALGVAAGVVHRVWVVRDPRKLLRWNGVGAGSGA
ncbi:MULTISPECIES: sigma factor [Actinoalloteichus]|uniref:sigma factor n=1 Tax=Actinoalloteichus TaxID=65496 RepID=UPI001FE16581|nr:sigma factor [Actinoalloteichus caeruleus]